LSAFPPPSPPPLSRSCSPASLVLRTHVTSRGRSSQDYGLSLPLAARLPPSAAGRPRDLSVLARGVVRVHALLFDRAGSVQISRFIDPASVAFRTRLTASAPGSCVFSRLNHPACTPPVNASTFPSRSQPHDSGSGWLRYLLSRMRLSLTTPRRFIPTLQARTPALRSTGEFPRGRNLRVARRNH
jgi:hypothetical protein